MEKPLIGITISQIHKANQVVNQNPSAYSEAILLGGGLPILIPNEFPLNQIPDLFSRMDGLLLSGGGDIDINSFNGEPHPTVAEVSAMRDQLEFHLLEQAIQSHKPVFGICRGLQAINVALGGTLYTDIPDQYPNAVDHNSPDHQGRDFLAHEVTLEQESALGKIIGQNVISVNSFHHQAIKKTAPGLVVTGRASDGLIEAVEWSGSSPFLIGVQWHPECLLHIEHQQNLFKAFIAAC